MRSSDYYKCPDCGKRRVTLHLRSGGEDWYGCDQCQWNAYTSDEACEVDKREMKRLNETNRDMP